MGIDLISYLMGKKKGRSEGGTSAKVYGFHIDSSESDPSAAVTYLADAVGMTPAHMDYANDRFDWGSWKENEFFMPIPCGQLATGRVLEYLDPNDYSKTVDGTPSHISDENGLFDPDTLADVTGIAAMTEAYDSTATYSVGDYCIRTGLMYECTTAITAAEAWTAAHWRLAGVHVNAMMEWGRDGKRIWYKIVPEGDRTSGSVYIADGQVDNDYRVWPFINNHGVLVKHFYTPIYNGSIDSAGRLRSLSGKGYAALCQNKTAAQEIAAAELNNPGTDRLWYTEVYADVTLINILLILMAKSLDTQTAYGQGRCDQPSVASSILGTGTMDNKELFWGSSDSTYGVKVFGMENWWGNLWRRIAGYMMIDHMQKYIMTYGRQDGSTTDGYNTTGDGYLIGANGSQQTYGFVTKMKFDENCFLPTEVGGDYMHNWCDYWYQNRYETRYAIRGGNCSNTANGVGAFYVSMIYAPTVAAWNVGAALSCKPLA